MQTLLHLFHYDFVQNAYLAGTIVALVAAVMGYFVVLRAQAFASEAMSDIGLAGAAGAALLGVGSLVGMFCLTILAALGMGALGERLRGRDVEIGMILSFALGLGALFLIIYSQTGTNAAVGINVLFGSIVSVTRGDVLTTLYTGLATLLCIALLFRPLLFASIDPEVAQTRGVPVRLLSMLFLVLLAIATAEAILVVGALLVLALLIAPAATALSLTRRPLTSLLLSIALGLFIIWGGADPGPGWSWSPSAGWLLHRDPGNALLPRIAAAQAFAQFTQHSDAASALQTSLQRIQFDGRTRPLNGKERRLLAPGTNRRSQHKKRVSLS